MKPIAFFLILASLASAQTNGLKIKKVDVFKNGTAFFIAEGNIKLYQGEGTISPVPQGSFGTLWIAAMDKNVTIDEIKSVVETTSGKKKSENMLDALRANIGKKIIWYSADEKQAPITGLLESVSGTLERSMITVRTGSQTQLLSLSYYYNRIEFPDGYDAQSEDTTKHPSLKVKTSGGKSECNFQMIYFQNELGWTPSYRIDLVDDKNAQIILAASLVNDAQDFEQANLNFVVGFPHFKYVNVSSPLTTRETIGQFITALEGGYNAYNYTNYQAQSLMNAAAPISELAADRGGSESYSNFRSVEGKAEEDLFFYNLPSISLKKGERAQYNIFSATVPYQHIYETNLPNALHLSDGYNSENTQQRKEPSQVWHSVQLENRSQNPWTTGSAFTLQNGKPLGQDVLRYTPVKSSANVRITQSPDIHVMDEEKESGRKEEVRKKDGYFYDLVTINGEIIITNYKDKDIRIMVSRPVSGKIIASSDQPKIVQPARIGSAINPENNVTWEIPIKAGEEKKLTYQYEVLLRR
jgi:hypothetical protein